MLISPSAEGADIESAPSHSGLSLLGLGLRLVQTLAHRRVEGAQHSHATVALVLGRHDVDGSPLRAAAVNPLVGGDGVLRPLLARLGVGLGVLLRLVLLTLLEALLLLVLGDVHPEL